MRINFFFISFIIILLLAPSVGYAGEYDDRFSVSIENFRAEVANEVESLINDDDNIINELRTVVIRILYFLLLFYAIVDFISNGFSAERTLNAALMGFLVGLLSETYLLWTEGLYQFFEVAALGIQDSVTGTPSKYFLSTYVSGMWDEIDFISVDIFDGAYLLFIFLIFTILKFALLLVVHIAEVWAVWGFSFAQLIGPLFIPFIIFPATRPLFDKWLGLLVSFCVYAFAVRIIGVLYAIFSSSILGTATYTETIDGGLTLTATSPVLLPVLIHSVIGIMMLLGAGKISGSLAGGVGGSGFTNSSMRQGSAMAKKMFTKLMV